MLRSEHKGLTLWARSTKSASRGAPWEAFERDAFTKSLQAEQQKTAIPNERAPLRATSE